jgi:hypothetical protein
MGSSFQLPFAFSFREELNFDSFRATAANALLLQYLGLLLRNASGVLGKAKAVAEAQPRHLLQLHRARLSLPLRQNRACLLLRLHRLHRQQHLHLRPLHPLRLAIPVPARVIMVRVILPRAQQLVLLLMMMHRRFLLIRFQRRKVLRH